MPRPLTDLENAIVAFCREHDCLAELCVWVDYSPEEGRVPEHWVPRGDVLQLAQHLLTRT